MPEGHTLFTVPETGIIGEHVPWPMLHVSLDEQPPDIGVQSINSPQLFALSPHVHDSHVVDVASGVQEGGTQTPFEQVSSGKHPPDITEQSIIWPQLFISNPHSDNPHAIALS